MDTLTDHITFYLPVQTITNADLSERFDTSEAKLFKNTGILKRYRAADDELASDMAVKAATRFFEESKIDKRSIDFLIFCSECFDYIAPATSCILQDRLGLGQHIGCLDLPYGCSGYVYGLSIAKSLIMTSVANRVLFITADTPSKTVRPDDLGLLSIFSDASSVTLISRENYLDIGHFVFGTDGSGRKNLYARNSGFREEPEEKDALTPKHGTMVMDGLEIFNFGLRMVPKLVQDVIEKNGTSFDKIDLFILHQPTRFLLETLRKKMNIPEEKFFIDIGEHGNTVSASIPLALKDALDQGRISKGMTVLLAGFGIGYSWAGTVIRI